jgi:hypothetical protein
MYLKLDKHKICHIIDMTPMAKIAKTFLENLQPLTLIP